jgi:Tol biopolymer transport system component
VPLSAGDKIGIYEVVAPLGAGGMGEVYRARDGKLKRDVAIKVLPADMATDPDRLARFQREAEVLASLNHPNIAHVYGVEDGALVMELVAGEDLSQRLARGALPIDDALSIAKQIAEALEAAHEASIVHRDLKPANVKLRDDGTVKVLDFGLARPGASAGSSAELASSPTITSPAMTMRGMIMGTAAYMAPEQAKGKVVDKRADIWAFGCLVYEMLTGKRAFDGEDVTDTIAAVVSKEPDWSALPPETPAHVTRALQRCLAKDRQRRVRDIADALYELTERTAPAAAPPHVHGRRAVAMIGVAAVAAIAALSYPAIQHWQEPARMMRPLRATIDAPPHASRLLSPEISPDGQSLLFGLVNAEGAPEMWIRRFDEVVSQRVTGMSPPNGSGFWAPDGRSFAYPSRNGLFVHDLTTNSSRALVNFAATLAGVSRFFGTWSRESGIVYGVGRSIHRVVEEGTRPLRFEGLAEGADQRFPTFLPDGRHLLFLAGDDPTQSSIYLGSIDGGPARKLLTAESQAVYAEPAPGRGHLLFVRDGNLIAQPFSLDTQQIHGEPAIVAANVPLYSAEFLGTGRGQFAASQDGVVVYLSQPNLVMPRLTWFDRQGKELATVGEPALYFGPRIAPDGKRVAVSRLDVRTRFGDIYVIDEAGSSQRLTFDPANEIQPVWTPSGEHVIFASHRNGKSQLFRKRADGTGGEELLYESDYSLAPDDVSLDGAFVLFRESHPVNENDLWVLPLDGSQKARPLVVGEADVPRARFSPDGRLVTYMSGGQQYALSFPDLSSQWQVNTIPGNVPQWRRDGREVFYQAVQGELTLFSQPVLSTVPLRLGERVRLFRPPITPRGSFFHASADGQRFLFAVEPPQPDLTRYHVAVDWLKTP